ncbi:MAG: hypothetical protein JWO94_3191 [Verrucomicrobiaceae bacterium]|nr:hypothetical protein [Verrucomicrobiaceae bacterium]
MKWLRILAFIGSLGLVPSGLRAAEGTNLLTVEDLKAYYGETFTVTPDPKPTDPVAGGGGKLLQLTFMAMEPQVRVATLLIRESESPAAAHKAAEAVRTQYGKMGIKIEDAPGIGELAFFFGRQLVFAKGNESFVLAVPGLKKDHDPVQCHAAAVELAKKIAERVK